MRAGRQCYAEGPCGGVAHEGTGRGRGYSLQEVIFLCVASKHKIVHFALQLKQQLRYVFIELKVQERESNI